jgi:hypothetical protein
MFFLWVTCETASIELDEMDEDEEPPLHIPHATIDHCFFVHGKPLSFQKATF